MAFEESIKIIVGFLTGSGISGAVIIIYLIKNPEKIELWASMFYRLFARFSKRSARNYMATNIQSTISNARKKIKLDERGLAYGIEIKWTDADVVLTDLDKDNVIVMMRPYHSQAINLAHVVSIYVPEALLPTSRTYVDAELMTSIDHTVSKTILKSNSTALNYYVNNFLTEPTEGIKDYMLKLEQLNEYGYLSRILITEYERLSVYYPSVPTDEVINESIELLDCIHEYIKKNLTGRNLEGEGIYSGNIFNMTIIPVGRSDLLEEYGIKKHFGFLKKLFDTGLTTFYIVSFYKDRAYVNEIIEKCKDELGLVKLFSEHYRGMFRRLERTLSCTLITTP